MKILSIDVGIKNLAFCLLEIPDEKKSSVASYKIIRWDSISLLDQKACINCGKPAKFCKWDKYYCRKHAKAVDQYQIPSAKDLSLKRLNKTDLQEYIDGLDISLNIFSQPKKNQKRQAIIEELEQYNNQRFFDPVKEDNAGLVSLIEIGYNLQQRFDNILTGITLDNILIENQLSNIAVRMKTLQGMITQYFIMRGYRSIEYIASQNKLKLFQERDKGKAKTERTSNKDSNDKDSNDDQEKNDREKNDREKNDREKNDREKNDREKNDREKKTSYSDRKRMGIQYCTKVLDSNNMDDWLEYMNKHGKRDDLADCFLQGLWWLSR